MRRGNDRVRPDSRWTGQTMKPWLPAGSGRADWRRRCAAEMVGGKLGRISSDKCVVDCAHDISAEAALWLLGWFVDRAAKPRYARIARVDRTVARANDGRIVGLRGSILAGSILLGRRVVAGRLAAPRRLPLPGGHGRRVVLGRGGRILRSGRTSIGSGPSVISGWIGVQIARLSLRLSGRPSRRAVLGRRDRLAAGDLILCPMEHWAASPFGGRPFAAAVPAGCFGIGSARRRVVSSIAEYHN